MKKILSIILVLCLLIVSLAACSQAPSTSGDTEGIVSGGSSAAVSQNETNEGQTLNLFTWEGMFPEEVLKGFTEETGIAINYVNFDYDETMLAKLQTAKGGDYDLVIADDYIIELAVSEGLVSKLDKEKISNYININSIYQGQFYDPADEYTVPYGAGVQTIVYNPDMVDMKITGYEDLWNESLSDNVGIIASSRVIDGMALKVLGESYNVEDIATIEEAGEKLLELAPNIRLIKDDNIQDDLLSGEINAAVMYTSQVTMSKLANPGLEIIYPKEGIGFGIMPQFIPVNAPNPEAAYAFIDYILRPEVSAACFEFLGYYCTNLAAEEHISDEMKDFLTLPEEFDMDSMEMIENISAEAQEAHEKVWTAFKSACGE